MITGPLNEMLARNAKLAETYQAPPSLMEAVKSDGAAENSVVVVSCCDPRLNPYQILGIDHKLRAVMVRNAGGRVFDTIRTLAVLQTIGTSATIVVIHHTDCGMTHLTDAKVREGLLKEAPEAKAEIDKMKFGEILDIDQSIIEDVAILKASPLIRKTTQIIGLKYDINTGLLSQVE